jgi:putative FmdB family regulatory protein
MPTYAYHCESCGHDFEQFRSINGRDDQSTCPACSEKEKVARIPVLGMGFALNDAQPLSRDFKNLLGNLKKKNSSMSHKSTINDSGL